MRRPKPIEEAVMRFIVGVLGGLVAGAAGAVWYSQQTGRDLRAEFEQVRAEIKARDFDALGAHLEDRFKELQASLDKLSSEAGQEARKAGKDGADSAKSAAKDAADEVEKVATPA
jgi:gas vesicle protein